MAVMFYVHCAHRGQLEAELFFIQTQNKTGDKKTANIGLFVLLVRYHSVQAGVQKTL